MTSGIAGLGSTGTATTVDQRLKPAAHEFEACMMKELLEPLQKDALAGDEGSDGSGESSGNALTSFGSEALARAISDHGGFGIAPKIIEHFEKAAKAGLQADGNSGRDEKKS